ncbi:MAG: hypothetical protein MUE47_10855 [Acidobacteria bacterium]|nr:hypothetical protein [Acidobacteriota bacterium]
MTDQLKAQSIVAFRQLKMREKALAASARIRLEDLGRAIAEGQLKELAIVLKADVQGSLEAVADQLNKLPQDKIKIRIIRQGVGAVTEGDVLLAAASNAVVIGFNVRPERKAAEIAGSSPRRRTPSSSASTSARRGRPPRSRSATRSSCGCTRSSTTSPGT